MKQKNKSFRRKGKNNKKNKSKSKKNKTKKLLKKCNQSGGIGPTMQEAKAIAIYAAVTAAGLVILFGIIVKGIIPYLIARSGRAGTAFYWGGSKENIRKLRILRDRLNNITVDEYLENIKEISNDDYSFDFISKLFMIDEKIEDKNVNLPTEQQEMLRNIIDYTIKIYDENPLTNIEDEIEDGVQVNKEEELNRKIEVLKESSRIDEFFIKYSEIIKIILSMEKKNVGKYFTSTNKAFEKFITKIYPFVKDLKPKRINPISDEIGEGKEEREKYIAKQFLINIIRSSKFNLSKIRQFFINCGKNNPNNEQKQDCRSALLSIDLKRKYIPKNFLTVNETDRDSNIINYMKELTKNTFFGVIEGIDIQRQKVEEQEQQEQQSKSNIGGKKSRKRRKGRKQRKTRRHRRRKH